MKERIEEACGRKVSRETFERLFAFADLLKGETARQNLISAASLETLWERHLIDSAQLVRFEVQPGASWVDIGAGAGLPGIVIACLVDGPVTLIEPRRLRAEFLQQVIDKLALNARVIAAKAEKASGRFDMITARAVASVSRVLEISIHLSTGKSCWVLPKGKSGQSELAKARVTWQGMFHVELSFTDRSSEIVIATQVKARGR
ncbi:MAG: 16S rRNA (guanine(527)-N(7))-methyltransferase RsmG [Sphingomonas sp.]|nr:16S rRNA (guanine(527)-N(7))-methyltransferase RsmG [Sphingomonas sp.]